MTYPSGPHGYGYAPPPPPPKPGVIPLAPLSFSQILTGAFSTFGRYWKPLLGVAVTAYAAATLLVGGAMLLAWTTVADHVDRLTHLPSQQEPDFADIQPLLVAFGCVWLAGVTGLILASGLVYAAAPAVAQEAVLGRPLGFGTVWRRAWSRLGSVLASVFLTMLASFVPMVLCMVGLGFLMTSVFMGVAASERGGGDNGSGLAVIGVLIFLGALATAPLALWLWVKFSLAPSVAVIEGLGATASMRRSSHLVRGSWWRIFGCMLAAGVIVAVVSWAIQQVFSVLAMFPMSAVDTDAGTSAGEIIGTLSGTMAVLFVGTIASQAVLAPLQPLVSALLYVDQRIRKENLAPVLAQAATSGP
ncbi:oxidoreductase [Streptomyces sp. NPDC085481]|uniref:oxidoreductase n=1 Tax=Streptomyces sp. NPDC085481 TaxID=3365727 RepID=UPI0037D36338